MGKQRVYHWARSCLGALILAAFLSQGAVVAPGQEVRRLPSVDTAMLAGPVEPATEQFDQADPAAFLASDPSAANTDPLAARVAELEKTLKDLQDKADEAKAKAARRPVVNINGRTYFDAGFFTQDELNKATYGDMTNGMGFRNVRLTAEGTVVENLDFKTSLEFTAPIFDAEDGHAFLGAGLRFKDVYMTLTQLPWIGNLRAGQMKEPYNLENLTSNRFMTFMDRNMARTAFTPDRTIGVMAFNWTDNQRATWAVGYFQNDVSLIFPRRDDDDMASAVTARITGLPWYDEGTQGRGTLHLGASYSYRDGYDAAHHFFAMPETAFGGPAAVIVDGDSPELTNWQLAGLEFLWIDGPFSIQSEYMEAFLNPPGEPYQTIPSAYVTFSWFLTGENRGYRRDMAVPDRIRPFENFFWVKTEDHRIGWGRGAWEVAYRADYIDLYDMGPAAGRAIAQTWGINWYLSPYARLMFNYVHANTDKFHQDTGDVDVFQMRAHLEF